MIDQIIDRIINRIIDWLNDCLIDSIINLLIFDLPAVETVSPQEQLPQHSSHGGMD